jgi:hypothetical protein
MFLLCKGNFLNKCSLLGVHVSIQHLATQTHAHIILATAANVQLLMCVLKTNFTCMGTSLFVVYRRFFGFILKIYFH